MNRVTCLLRWAGLPALALLAGASFGGDDTAPPVKRPADVGKGKIEFPVKDVVAARSSTAPVVEDKSANPKVAPGKVKWHPSFEEACTAAQKSGKPVLLFQMMGKLDEQFC
jgi:hypothetical protein